MDDNKRIHLISNNYDVLDRLVKAEHWVEDRIWIPVEQVTYDKNSNILGLQRYGQTDANTYDCIDELSYTYDGNQLQSVNDTAKYSAYNNGFEFKDGAKAAVEYAYDVNGNLIKDLNKNITDIQYNFLNLPTLIQFSDESNISYLYDASGTKLRTTHCINGVTTTTDYCGNAIYENGVLTMLFTEAGYITFPDKVYHYYLQDHQGNNCIVINDTGEIEEMNLYYPFGGIYSSTNSTQPYKYNGKELDTKHGLNWHDYGARHYDAALGRWHAMDPMAEKYDWISPYVYCGNNPINGIDPDGMDYWSTSDPSQIQQVLDAINSFPSAAGNILESVDFSSWNHSTDGEFLSKLTFNDQTNMFYSSYGIFEKGELTSVGVSFPAMSNDGK